jgi:hypothetical protein
MTISATNKRLLIMAINLIIVLALVILVDMSNSQLAHGNELAVGRQAKVYTPLVVPLNKPVNLSFKLRDEILQMREEVVNQVPQLLAGEYHPSDTVFEHIQDRRPWQGLAGESVFGPGEKSITGPSEETRFLLNPYLLIGLDSATNRIWNPEKFNDNELNDPDFPFYWQPETIRYEPKLARAQVIYNVTAYNKKILASGKLLQPIYVPYFMLVGYNARDFGLEYARIDEQQSYNINNKYPAKHAIHITHFIHCGTSCGFPGGCNNMSPYINELDHFSYEKLPARLVVDLYKNDPSSPETPPDFIEVIDLY